MSKLGVDVLGPCRTCMRPEVELSVSVAHWPGETPAVGAGVGVATGVGVAAAAYLLMWALRLRSVWAYIGLMLVGSVGVGFFNMVIWAFITDVIDYQEVRTGSRDDGTVYAVYSFARKLGQALAGGVVGFALAAIGYVSSTGHVVQTQPVREGIYTISTLVPGLSYLGVFLVGAYQETLGDLHNLLGVLRERRGEAAQEP